MRHRTTLIALALIILVSALLQPLFTGTILLMSGHHHARCITPLFLLMVLLLAMGLVLPRLFSRY